MARVLRLFVLRSAVLTALILSMAAVPPETVDTVRIVPCDTRPAPRTYDLQLQCAQRSTWPGAVGGGGIGMPSRGASWTQPNSGYGQVVKGGTFVKATKTMSRLQRMAKRHKVPWPSSGAKRAEDMSTHRIYQVYAPAKKGGHRVYKYGITKAGEARPKRQLRRCKRAMGVDCTFSWVRNDVDGWLKARKVEAGYATKYKMRFDRCPPGMPRCL